VWRMHQDCLLSLDPVENPTVLSSDRQRVRGGRDGAHTGFWAFFRGDFVV
jgi:hypothetical protein